MQGFRDQIARQYDALVSQTQLEPTIEEPHASLWLSTSVRQEVSNAGSWLELGEYTEESLLSSKDHVTDPTNSCGTRLYTSVQTTTPITTTTHSRQSVSSTTESGMNFVETKEEHAHHFRISS